MDIKTQRWDTLWSVRVSQRYHARRMAFFDRWHKITGIVGVLGGSAVFVSMANYAPAWLASVGAGLIVILSSIDVVVGTAEMARRHNDLRRRFCLLEAAIEAVPEPTAKVISRWKDERLSIESDEPPVFVALAIQCDNEMRRATDHISEKPLHPIPWHKATTAHWLRWENA